MGLFIGASRRKRAQRRRLSVVFGDFGSPASARPVGLLLIAFPAGLSVQVVLTKVLRVDIGV